jgi:hypothetical protein
MIPKWTLVRGQHQARGAWALFGDMGKLRRGGLH